MDIDAFHQREKTLELREALLNVEESRQAGSAGHSIEEVNRSLEGIIEGDTRHGTL